MLRQITVKEVCKLNKRERVLEDSLPTRDKMIKRFCEYFLTMFD